MQHPIRGLLVGPITPPIAYWVVASAHALANGSQFSWLEALRELAVVAAFGVPISYAVALIWGAPVIYALHRLGWLRASTLIVTGALGGLIVALWLYFEQRYALFQVWMPTPVAILLGALAGGVTWRAGQSRSEHM